MRGNTVIIGALGLVCLYLAYDRAADPPPARSSPPDARVATVPQARWQPALAPPTPIDTSVDIRDHRDNNLVASEFQESREDGERARVDYLRSLDERLAREPSDPAWRPELALEATVHAIPGARARETRCTATFCRVVVARADALTENQLVEKITASADSPFAAGTMFDAAEHETTLYVFRPSQPVRLSERTP